MNAPRLAITPGEPAGIGPDLCVGLAQRDHEAELVIIADPQLLQQRAEQLQVDLNVEIFDPSKKPQAQKRGSLKVLPVSLQTTSEAGKLDRDNANYVLDTLSQGVAGCMESTFDALVTGPVHKGIINQAGIPFSGHTEFLAELTHAQPVMMLATEGLRVALATTHLPLIDVSQAITKESLEQTIRILHQDLIRHFGIKKPNILVAGLNPHAGEDGHLGREEIDTIIPVLKKLREEGMSLEGPLPADTLFVPRFLSRADAVLAMYHDQGLPVLKHLGFGQAVNITLGLPIIRTSVDHGTALELAGKGELNSGSLETALTTAMQMVRAKRESNKL